MRKIRRVRARTGSPVGLCSTMAVSLMRSSGLGTYGTMPPLRGSMVAGQARATGLVTWQHSGVTHLDLSSVQLPGSFRVPAYRGNASLRARAHGAPAA